MSAVSLEAKRKRAAYHKAYQQRSTHKAKRASAYRARAAVEAAKRLSALEAKATHPRPDVCEVCDKPPTGKHPLHFDHCHTTGAFRGWLCVGCNTALGSALDDPAILRKLADYLERFPRDVKPRQEPMKHPRKALPLFSSIGNTYFEE